MVTATWKHKLGLLLLFSVLYALFYVLPNLFPLFPPKSLPLLALDEAIPLIPWTFVVYLSDYFLFAVTIIIIKRVDEYNAWARVAFGVLFICGFFFLFFPTTYPRPLYPADTGAFVAFFMNLVGTADTPNNCFPSLHVAATTAAAWAVRNQGKGVRQGVSVWAMAIILSTLTTKQHYFVDILGGLAVTASMIGVEWAFFQKKIFVQTIGSKS